MVGFSGQPQVNCNLYYTYWVTRTAIKGGLREGSIGVIKEKLLKISTEIS